MKFNLSVMNSNSQSLGPSMKLPIKKTLLVLCQSFRTKLQWSKMSENAITIRLEPQVTQKFSMPLISCDKGILKDKFQIVEKKGLTHALEFPTIFKTKWIRIVLSRIHDGSLWLEASPIKISKRIVHRVIGYPTLDWTKTLKSDSKEAIEKNTGAKWNKRGMTIDNIQDPIVDFVVRVISHKFYQSSRLNSVP